MWTDPITWATAALLVAPFAVLELRRHRRRHRTVTIDESGIYELRFNQTSTPPHRRSR